MTKQKYLDPKEAIRLMLDGEVLQDSNRFYRFNKGAYCFESKGAFGWKARAMRFDCLRRKPRKRNGQ
ncbi:hypothetical protein NO1_0568 [Candidatus Termititenax aidoneus]|uniref:Uncharacterized protein n=1 Tax=Termititenax aidoneus TaxID=2218524 RepID=A0A388T942_TERA1|nr:hypothetical protein NO1_0568 [Candidatus Termititenax aidoneus]